VVSAGCSASQREIVAGATRWPYREEIYCAFVWDRSADHIRASGLTAALKGRIHDRTRTLRSDVRFLLHRGRRPYMTHYRQNAASHEHLRFSHFSRGCQSISSNPSAIRPSPSGARGIRGTGNMEFRQASGAALMFAARIYDRAGPAERSRFALVIVMALHHLLLAGLPALLRSTSDRYRIGSLGRITREP
jgi:hypothetical protein